MGNPRFREVDDRKLPRDCGSEMSERLERAVCRSIPETIDQQRDHAPRVRGFFLVRDPAQVGDGMEQLFGIHAGAYRSSYDGGVKQGLQGRKQACVEELRKSAVGRVAGVQGCSKSTLRGNEVHIPLHPAS